MWFKINIKKKKKDKDKKPEIEEDENFEGVNPFAFKKHKLGSYNDVVDKILTESGFAIQEEEDLRLMSVSV